MIGLALEGGGVRGSYQAGVYMAILDAHIKIDGVCGTSIGAINGAMIASGKGKELPKLWQSLSMGEIFGFQKEFVEQINKKKISLNLIKLSLANFLKILKSRGIDVKGIKDVLAQNLNVDDLLNSKMDYGLCTVRFNDLKPLYIFKEDMEKEKIKDYILASAFLPIFREEKLIDEHYYLDGGFYDLGPVNMLLNKGYKKVYLVKVKGIGIHRPYDKNKVVVIESKRSLGKVLDLDPKRVEENIKMGYYDGIRYFKNYDGEKYVFKRKNENYYKFLNRKVNKKLYKRVSLFFNTSTFKETTIKALEYIMEHQKVDYYKIYSSRKMIKYINKNFKKKYFIYDYVRDLKLITGLL